MYYNQPNELIPGVNEEFSTSFNHINTL